MSRSYRTPDDRKGRKGIEENEDDDETSCLEKICCCMKPPRRKDGKSGMSYDQRNGDTEGDGIYRHGGRYVDNPGLKTGNGEEIDRQDQESSGSPKGKNLDLVMETVSRPDAGQGLFQEQQKMFDKQDSSHESLRDGKLNPPETNVSSSEADLSRKQQKGHSPLKINSSEAGHLLLPKEQQNEYTPRKPVSSSEAGPLLSKEQQKIYSPKKTLGSPEVSHLLLNEPKKANPPRKTVSSSETGGNLLLKEQQNVDPTRKTASSSTQADQLMPKEQQMIELARKTFSSPQESQLLSNEKQKGLIKDETSYGSLIFKQLDSPIKTSNTPKQGGHLWSKEQDKDVMQKGINRERIYAESTPLKVTNRSSGNKLEEQQKGVLKHGNNSESHTKKTIGSAEQAGLSMWKGKQKDVVRQDDKYDKSADTSSLR